MLTKRNGPNFEIQNSMFNIRHYDNLFGAIAVNRSRIFSTFNKIVHNWQMTRSKKEKRNFVPIGHVIRDILKQSRVEADTSMIRIWDIWEKAVGQAIADNTQPAAFKGDLLIVHATSSSWLQQLRFLKGDIIKKVNLYLGQTKVKDIKFKIGPVD